MESRKTPLYDAHRALGARFVDFAGWEMPVQYTGVIDEHQAVRGGVGLFDVSHMGEIEVSGPGALETVQRLITNDITRITDGQCQYTLLCREDGGVVDDCIVYRLGSENFLFCVNASNTSKVFAWLSENAGPGADVIDRSPEYAQLALQGPASVEVLRTVLGGDPDRIASFRFVHAELFGARAIVSRTGYTGEDGFEIYIAPEGARALWDALMGSGGRYGIKPVGLGARDTLRLEMGYPLYGHELTDETTPIEAGLNRFVALGKGDFIGSGVLRRQESDGVGRRLAGFEMTGPGVPRQGYAVRSGGSVCGAVTSGTMSPSLKKGIGMAYVKSALASPGTEIEIEIRGRAAGARVVSRPFYKKKSLAGC